MAEIEDVVITRYVVETTDLKAKLNEIKQVNTDAAKSADATSNAFKGAGEQIAASLTKTSTSMQAMNAKAAQATNELFKMLQGLLKSSNDSGKSLEKLKSELNLVAQGLEKAKPGSQIFKDLAQRSADLQKAIAKTTEEIDAFGDTAEESLQRQYKKALQDAQKGIEGAAEKAAELRDQIDDTNESVANLASGSKLEQFNNVLGSVTGKIANLDFGGAAESANQLQQVASKITFKEATTGIKDLGSSLVNTGKAILSNPLFILAGVIGGITYAIYQLVTAENEQVKKLREAAQLQEETSRLAILSIDQEIKAAKALGETTVSLEEEKRKEIIKTLQAKVRAAKFEYDIERDRAEQVLTALGGEDFARQEILKSEVSGANEKYKKLSELEANLTNALGDQNAARLELLSSAAKSSIEYTAKEEKTRNDLREQSYEKEKARLEKLKAQREKERQQAIEDEIAGAKAGTEAQEKLQKESAERTKGAIDAFMGELPPPVQLIDTDYEKEFEALKNRKDYLKGNLEERQAILDEGYANAIISQDQYAEASKEIEKQRTSIFIESAKAGANAFISMFDTLAQLEGQGSNFAKASAVFQIGLDLAQSLAATIAGATKAAAATGPAAPFTLAGYIASGIAAVFSAFAQVKQLVDKQPPPPPSSGGKRFALGTPYVEGGRPGVDSVPALLMPGERVMTTRDNLQNWDALEAMRLGKFDRYVHDNYVIPEIAKAQAEAMGMEGETLAHNMARSLLLNGQWKGKNIISALKDMDNNEDARTAAIIHAIGGKKTSLRKQL